MLAACAMLGVGQRRTTPAGFVHAIIQHGAEGLGVERHLLAGDVGVLAGVRRAANGDVGLHLLHAREFDVADERGVFLIGVADDFARHAAVAHFDDGDGADLPRGAHQFHGEFVRHVDDFDEDAFAAFQRQEYSMRSLASFAKRGSVMWGRNSKFEAQSSRFKVRVAGKEITITSRIRITRDVWK